MSQCLAASEVHTSYVLHRLLNRTLCWRLQQPSAPS